MKQISSSEANRSEDIQGILWTPEGSSLHSQEPATCPYPEAD